MSQQSMPFAEVTESGYSADHLSGLSVEGSWKEVVLNGTCPRCAHTFQFVHPWRGFRSPLRQRPSGLLPVQVVCVCEEEHPGRPADDEGCGAFWIVLLRRDSQ